MRVVIQRVKYAEVIIDGKEKKYSGRGLMILLGIENADEINDVHWLVNKILNLRIFNDKKGVMNHSLLDIQGELMIISQFTLMAKTKKGNRPSYIRAASHEHAIPLYNSFIEYSQKFLTKPVVSGKFGSEMQIELINDGPVTIFIDSKKRE